MINPPPMGQTLGLTPITATLFLPQSDDSVTAYRFVVLAFDHDTGVAYWDIRCLARKVGSGTPVNIIVAAAHQASVAATTWTATASSDANGQMLITMTGAALSTVDWMWSLDDVNAVAMVGPLP